MRVFETSSCTRVHIITPFVTWSQRDRGARVDLSTSDSEDAGNPKVHVIALSVFILRLSMTREFPLQSVRSELKRVTTFHVGFTIGPTG